MPHAYNGRQIFEQMQGPWPKTSAEIIDWARTHEEFPQRFLSDLRQNLPDRTWQDWDELRNEVQNYTWTVPDGTEDERVVWGGATRHEPVA